MSKLPLSYIRALKEDSGSDDNLSDHLLVSMEQVSLAPESRVALITDPRGPGSDRFRLLRMRLAAFKEKAKIRSLAVTSPLPRDGKSTVSINLATALAEGGGSRVLLIEADLHQPSLAGILGVQRQPGLAECLQDGVDPASVIKHLEPLSWNLLQAGEPKGNPTELLQSEALGEMLRKLSRFFDWILIDTPPVAPLTDALSIARHVDASLLVVRADQTPRSAVEEALDRLGRKNVLGMVLNGAHGLNELYSQYYGYYSRK